jgi:hypothetical protein
MLTYISRCNIWQLFLNPKMTAEDYVSIIKREEVNSKESG